ncbi:MAG: response regulator transcription factor [Pseudohongiella sp.]|nr:response regulator transcription factor [Pseudohongiella sp.]
MWVQEQGSALVVEDNPETRVWLCSCVVSAFPGLTVHAAANLAEAMSLLGGMQFDLALVDLGLPDGSGMDVIRALHSAQAQCHVVVATIYDDDRNLFAALKLGAKGYILKDQDRGRIVSYLQGIKKDQPAMSAASSQRLINHFNNKADALAQAKLTPREVEVLCMIGKGFSVEDAAGMLQLSTDTVKGYVKTIYNKLGVSNRSEVTLEAIRLGLIDVD